MNSVAVSVTTQIAPPSHIFQTPAEPASPYADFVSTAVEYVARSPRTEKKPRARRKYARPLAELGDTRKLETFMYARCEHLLGAQLRLLNAKKSSGNSRLNKHIAFMAKKISSSGKIVPAQIDMATGEIVPWEHVRRTPPELEVRSRSDGYAESGWKESSFKEIKEPTASACDDDNRIARKSLANYAKPHLQGYSSLTRAHCDFPFLEGIVSGAASLDLGGNTRPLSTRVLYSLLQGVDVITAPNVRRATGLGVRHSEKVAKVLRIIVTQTNREFSKLPEPVH